MAPNHRVPDTTISARLMSLIQVVMSRQDLGLILALGRDSVANALDPAKYTVDSVHPGTSTSRVKEAEAGGVKSVSALVMNGAHFTLILAPALTP